MRVVRLEGVCLVGTDNQARHEFIRQAVEVTSVELCAGAATEVALWMKVLVLTPIIWAACAKKGCILTVLLNMLADLGHRVADIGVGV